MTKKLSVDQAHADTLAAMAEAIERDAKPGWVSVKDLAEASGITPRQARHRADAKVQGGEWETALAYRNNGNVRVYRQVSA